MYVLGEDALAGNLEDCIVGGLWSAHHTMLFMVFSVELLSVFVPADQQVTTSPHQQIALALCHNRQTFFGAGPPCLAMLAFSLPIRYALPATTV